MESRTSSTSNLYDEDLMVKKINKRISKELQVPRENGETMQGQLYEVGQEFFRVIYPTTIFNDPESKEAYKISRKLMERYVGPYKIIRRISPVQYDADIDGVITRVHALNMKPN